MTRHFFLIFILVPFIGMAQFDYINQNSLYVANKISNIKSVYLDEDTREYQEIWKIDSVGRIIYYQLHTLWGKTCSGSTEWKYNGNLLSASTEVGNWSVKNHKLDTAITFYFYNNNELLVMTKSKHPTYEDTLTIEYKYNNGILIRKSNIYGGYIINYISYSYHYSASNKIKTETVTQYHKNNFDFYITNKTETYYDTIGLIQTEIDYEYINDCSFPAVIRTFIYDNGRLHRIKEVYFVNDSSKPHEYYEEEFEYNEKGLVSKVTTINNGSFESSYIYEYE